MTKAELRRLRENSKGEVQTLAGLVKCSKCGTSLNVNFDKKKSKYTGFSCWVYKNYGKDRCTSHTIGWKTMGQRVLEDIRQNTKAAKPAAPKYKERYKVMSIRYEGTGRT